jgi:phosphoglycolate phosphatase
VSPITKAVLFDFDLTLADSTVAIVECVQYSLRTMGRPVPTAEVIQKSIGLTLEDTFAFLSSSRDPKLIDMFSDLFISHADRVMVALTTLYPGVATLLRSLRSLGISTAIVSTKYRYRIEAILAQAGLQSCVDAIVGGEDVKRHKPHPEGLLKALEILNVEAIHALYVGDHPIDSQAARGAGVAFVGAVTGLTNAKGWQRLGRSALGTNINEVLGHLHS